MTLKLVSIIILTYNRVKLVKESISSIIQQTYPHFELLVIDDGSNDGTDQEIQLITDKRLRYFKLEHCGHTGHLKNFAMKKASGDFIAFNDSDDNWKPDKLEKQMKLFSEFSQIGFSITDVITIQEDKILIQHSYNSQLTNECTNIFERMIAFRFLVYPFTLVMKRECLERTGWFDEEMVSGDYHFIMRLAYHFKAGILYEPLVWRRVHDDNMSNRYRFENYAELVATFELLYRNKWIEKRHLRAARSLAFFSMARLMEKKGELSGARKHYITSIRQRWFHLDSYIGLIKTYLRSPSRQVHN